MLIMGQVYNNDLRVKSLLNDPDRHCVLLYPGKNSANLSLMPKEARENFCPAAKKLTVFVVDGTWATAKKTVNQSLNLQVLPRICFTPPGPSAFRVRKQPRAECYSTIEAIHHTIELLAPPATRAHDALLRSFDLLVERQIELAANGRPRGRSRRLPSHSETEL